MSPPIDLAVTAAWSVSLISILLFVAFVALCIGLVLYLTRKRPVQQTNLPVIPANTNEFHPSLELDLDVIMSMDEPTLAEFKQRVLQARIQSHQLDEEVARQAHLRRLAETKEGS